MAFVHLRMHTEYSVVDGTLRIDEAVAAAAADGQGALAITDLGNLFGAVKFYSAARRAGVKPIIGAELCLEPRRRREGAEPDRRPGAEPRAATSTCASCSRAAGCRTRERGHAWIKWELARRTAATG